MLKILNYIGLLLLLLSAGTRAQGGYNYARPEISNVAGGAAGSSNALRPLVPLGSNAITAPTNAAVGFPSPASSAFGGTAGTAAAPYAGFGAQPTALGPTAYAGATGAAPLQVRTGFNAAKRPVLATQQRGGGIYSGGLGNVAGVQTAYGTTSRASGLNDVDYSGEGDYSAIPGVPAVDYPVYAQVPQTNFDCTQQLPGYYSDVEAQCQVFHICALNRTYSFLCPNGTIFSQETLVCVWWNQFECGTAPALYANNAYIYDYGSEQRAAGSYSVSGTTAQLGARQPANYPAAGGGGSLRATNPTLPAVGGGIFGAGNLRSTAYGAVTPVPSTAGYSAGAVTGAGRFPAGTQSATQSFNTAAAPIAASQATYGAGPGTVGVPAGTVSSGANSNREYLPPTQQKRRP